jgi:hypothetical protein
LLPPSTTASVYDAAIGAAGSIPPLLLMTTTAIAAVNNRHRRCHTVDNKNCQKPEVMFVIKDSNGGHRQRKRQLMAATAMADFVNSGHRQQRRWWDGGTMTKWNWQQRHLWPMVAVAMAVIVVNCAAAVDAAATILSMTLTAAAKMPSPPLPLTTTSINNDCYHCH